MKTREAVLEAMKSRGEWAGAFLDGRDRRRLLPFYPPADWLALGFERQGEPEPDSPITPWTEEVIRERLASDLDFAFEKALGRRGISAELMYHVILMWLWILDDPLHERFTEITETTYPQYGLPLLKATALRFGLPNPIGDDTGAESRYASESDRDQLARAAALAELAATPNRQTHADPSGEWLFLFGPGHRHPDTGESLADRYVLLRGMARSDACRRMQSMFRGGWSHDVDGAKAKLFEIAYGSRELPRVGMAEDGDARMSSGDLPGLHIRLVYTGDPRWREHATCPTCRARGHLGRLLNEIKHRGPPR